MTHRECVQAINRQVRRVMSKPPVGLRRKGRKPRPEPPGPPVVEMGGMGMVVEEPPGPVRDCLTCGCSAVAGSGSTHWLSCLGVPVEPGSVCKVWRPKGEK